MPTPNTVMAPKMPWCASVVRGTQNSTSNGSPATAGLRSRTASRSVATAARPMPATVRSRIPWPAGAGGANLAVPSSPCRASRHRWRREVAVGMTPPSDCALENTTFRYSSKAARPMGAQSAHGSTRSLESAPARATTATAPAPSQNQSQPDTSGYRDKEAAIVATAAAMVSRWLTGRPRPGNDPARALAHPASRRTRAAAPRPW